MPSYKLNLNNIFLMLVIKTISIQEWLKFATALLIYMNAQFINIDDDIEQRNYFSFITMSIASTSQKQHRVSRCNDWLRRWFSWNVLAGINNNSDKVRKSRL